MKAALILTTVIIAIAAMCAAFFGLVWYAGITVGLSVALLAAIAAAATLSMLTGTLLNLAADAMERRE